MHRFFGERVTLGRIRPIIQQTELKIMIVDSSETSVKHVALMTKVTCLSCDTSVRLNVVPPVVSNLATQCATVLLI